MTRLILVALLAATALIATGSEVRAALPAAPTCQQPTAPCVASWTTWLQQAQRGARSWGPQDEMAYFFGQDTAYGVYLEALRKGVALRQRPDRARLQTRARYGLDTVVPVPAGKLLVVVGVVPGSPAATGGLKVGMSVLVKPKPGKGLQVYVPATRTRVVVPESATPVAKPLDCGEARALSLDPSVPADASLAVVGRHHDQCKNDPKWAAHLALFADHNRTQRVGALLERADMATYLGKRPASDPAPGRLLAMAAPLADGLGPKARKVVAGLQAARQKAAGKALANYDDEGIGARAMAPRLKLAADAHLDGRNVARAFQAASREMLVVLKSQGVRTRHLAVGTPLLVWSTYMAKRGGDAYLMAIVVTPDGQAAHVAPGHLAKPGTVKTSFAPPTLRDKSDVAELQLVARERSGWLPATLTGEAMTAAKAKAEACEGELWNAQRRAEEKLDSQRLRLHTKEARKNQLMDKYDVKRARCWQGDVAKLRASAVTHYNKARLKLFAANIARIKSLLGAPQ